MVKKNGMSKEEVERHLRGIPTLEGKHSYLIKMLQKGFLSEKTRDSIIGISVELMNEQTKSKYLYDENSKKGKYDKTRFFQREARKEESQGFYEIAAIDWEAAGDKEKAKEDFRRGAEQYEKEAKAYLQDKKGYRTLDELGPGTTTFAIRAIRLYKRAGDNQTAEKLGRETIRYLNRHKKNIENSLDFNEKYTRDLPGGPTGMEKLRHVVTKSHTIGALENIEKEKSEIEELINEKSLSRKVSGFVGIAGLFISIIFLSNSITGNAIGQNNLNLNWIGGVLFIIGLVGIFAYFKKI